MSNEPNHALRADNRVWEQLRQTTKVEYRKNAEQYIEDARDANFDPRLPRPHDLVKYFDGILVERGPNALRRLAAALVHYFQNEGVPVVIDHQTVTAALQRTRPGYAHLKGDDERSARAQWFAAQAYDPKTTKSYANAAKAYVASANSSGFDPRYPSLNQIKRYLDSLRSQRAASTVRNHANGIGAYFREQHVPDLIRTVDIRDYLRGLKRNGAPKSTTPLHVEDALTIAKTFDFRSPLDVRDALLLATAASAGLPYRSISCLDRSRYAETPNGVMFFTIAGEIFVSRSPHPELDVVELLKRWIAIIGTEPGPLFPILLPRGGYGEVMSDTAVGNVIRGLVSRLERPADQRLVLSSFRKGFTRRSTRANGDLLTAQAAGYMVTTGMRHYVPNAGRDVDLTFQRRAGAPRQPQRRLSR